MLGNVSPQAAAHRGERAAGSARGGFASATGNSAWLGTHCAGGAALMHPTATFLQDSGGCRSGVTHGVGARDRSTPCSRAMVAGFELEAPLGGVVGTGHSVSLRQDVSSAWQGRSHRSSKSWRRALSRESCAWSCLIQEQGQPQVRAPAEWTQPPGRSTLLPLPFRPPPAPNASLCFLKICHRHLLLTPSVFREEWRKSLGSETPRYCGWGFGKGETLPNISQSFMLIGTKKTQGLGKQDRRHCGVQEHLGNGKQS